MKYQEHERADRKNWNKVNRQRRMNGGVEISFEDYMANSKGRYQGRRKSSANVVYYGIIFPKSEFTHMTRREKFDAVMADARSKKPNRILADIGVV